ncbi:MAG TPA: serine/threonine-protein kinase, partial [Kofleriaceae bacterium]
MRVESTPCPDPEHVAGFVARTLGADGIAQLDAHIADCTACRKLVFALAHEPAGVVHGPALGPDSTGVVHAPAFALDSASALHVPTRLGRFEILDVIGQGSMGIVYRARDPELDRIVAIKARRDRSKLAAAAEERLRREARALARLDHPNVVSVHEMGTDAGVAYLAMEYVEGVTLAGWLQTAPSRAAIVELVVAAGRGLAAAHARGLIHRDFKPSNVLVSTTGVPKVGDFGLVRVDRVVEAASSGDHGELTMTSAGSLVGTPAYMAPEQLRGAVATEASDQFAFCVTLYEALYARRPFAGDTVAELVAAIERGPRFPAAPRVAGRIRRALERGLAADPGRRFASMDALLAKLSTRWNRAAWLGAVAAAGVAVTAIALASGAGGGVAPCSGSDAHVRDAWNGTRASAAERAFAATKLPYAGATWAQVKAGLDGYAAAWSTAHEGACLAGKRGETSPEVLDARMQCLDHRLDELRAFGDALVVADPAVVRRATRALGSLAPIDRCLDLDVNLARLAPPADPATRAAVDQLRRDLAGARITLDTGKLDAALAAVTPLVAKARTLGYAPVLAEALFVLGHAHTELEQGADARAALDEAARTAYAARHDEIAARAWIDLTYAAYQHRD